MSSSSSIPNSRYQQGLFFIVLVVTVWSGTAVFAKLLYTSSSLDSPFLLTFAGCALLTFWLPIHDSCSLEAAMGNSHSKQQQQKQSASYRQVSQSQNDDDDNDDDDAVIREDELHGTGPSASSFPNGTITSHKHHKPWTRQQHWRASLIVGPVWFLANWAYNASILETSISSSIVLSATSSLFAFLLSVCLGDDQFRWLKLVGVLMGMLGTFLTTVGDENREQEDEAATTTTDGGGRSLLLLLAQPLRRQLVVGEEGDLGGDDPVLGDVIALLSALGFGTYTVLTRVVCPKDEELYSMELILGYIGLNCCVIFGPFLAYQFLFAGLTCGWELLGGIVIKAAFDNFIGEFFWLRAVMLTNATVATVGLGLSIPFAFCSDLVLQGAQSIHGLSIAGAFSVLAGFVIVNRTSSHDAALKNAKHDDDDEEDDEEISPILWDDGWDNAEYGETVSSARRNGGGGGLVELKSMN